MTRFVLDAPTLVDLVGHDRPVDPAHRLVAPNGIRSQALQLLLDDVRAGRRTETEALALHERLTELRMRLLGDRVSRRTAWRLARDLDLDIGAAEYLAVARLQADALVTADPVLVAAASGLVPLATVDELAGP